MSEPLSMDDVLTRLHKAGWVEEASAIDLCLNRYEDFIAQLRDQVADRNDMIAAVEQKNDTLREQVAKLQAENQRLRDKQQEDGDEMNVHVRNFGNSVARNTMLSLKIAKLQAQYDDACAVNERYVKQSAVDMDRLASLIDKQNEVKIAKLEATIESVRRRIHWTPPKYGMHTNGPCYVFHDGYSRIIDEILNGQPFEESNDTHA